MTDSKKRFNIKVSENKYVPFFPFLFGSNRQKVSFRNTSKMLVLSMMMMMAATANHQQRPTP
jgi:hypothetical protein